MSPRRTELVARIDASHGIYARIAGRLPRSNGLELRGSVTWIHDGVLVVERRDGTVQVLKKMAASVPVKARTVLKRPVPKGSAPVNG